MKKQPKNKGKPALEGTRERIVREALRLFCHKGYEATSVREIVTAAGVTKPVLYYYFENKDALFRHIIESALLPFLDDMKEACKRGEKDFQAALRAIADLYIQAARNFPDKIRFIHAITFSGLYNEIFDFMGFWMQIFEMIEDLFKKGQKQKFLRKNLSPDIMARSFLGLCQSFMRTIVYCPIPLEEAPDAREIVDIILKGIQR